MKQRFIEASKNILEHPWTLDNWDSQYAVWLDDFELSDSETIDLFKREVSQSSSETALLGSLTDDSSTCVPGVAWLPWVTASSSFEELMNRSIEGGIEYMWENYAHEKSG